MKDMLGTVVRLLVAIPTEWLGTIHDLLEKLSGESGKEWLAQLKLFLRKEACWATVVGAGEAVISPILRLISGGEILVIEACDGTEILADASDVFPLIDSDFRNWGADEPGPATVDTKAAVYEMDKDAAFSQMFGSLSGDVSKLCLTQAQIKGFVKKHRRWLRTDGLATFFLFQSRGHLFVAGVYVLAAGRLKADVLRFEYSRVWGAVNRHRVVVPQLAKTR